MFKTVKFIVRSYVIYIKELSWYLGDIARFRHQPYFIKAERLLLKHYLLLNPYKLCKKYLKHIGAPPQPYGETRNTSLIEILDKQNLTPDDLFIDLGCGRGKLLFWMLGRYPCQLKGVDLNPAFIRIGRTITKQLETDRLSFEQVDIFETDLSEATLIYLYGSAFDDETVEAIAKHLHSNCLMTTRIITVSYALNEYCDTPLFETTEAIAGKFLWGETMMFVQKPLPPSITDNG